MRRTVTLSMVLAMLLVSGLGKIATASNVNHSRINDSIVLNNGTNDCKGDKDDPCEKPPATTR